MQTLKSSPTSCLFYSCSDLDFLGLPCERDLFLISTVRSTILEILVKLKAEIFAEENFAELSFAIYDASHRNLFRKK